MIMDIGRSLAMTISSFVLSRSLIAPSVIIRRMKYFWFSASHGSEEAYSVARWRISAKADGPWNSS
jgi:hypothetical protein